MQPLNPFLRALFRSTVPSQSIPVQNHVLLVPSTDSLLNGKDETGKRYAELVQDEEFLASHVMRTAQPAGKEGSNNVRDNRGKAKTYPTVNGRTVIIKENMVYSNKGFRQLTQAQLLTDVLYHSEDNQQWLIYYISKPLTGTFDPITILPASIGGNVKAAQEESAAVASLPKKKDIKTFNDLLNAFPMIARQMQPGLERLLNEFGKELGKPLPPPPSRTPSTHSLDESTRVGTENGSILSSKSNGSAKLPFSSAFDDAEDMMRRALESAVTAAIDLFQLVDKQQLSLLGATTDLTGPAVERLIERYVAEQVHDSLLFSRLCSFHKVQDTELDRRIRQMENIDVAQVGIAIEDGRRGKQELLRRVTNGVTAFRKMGVASSPHEMLDILLETQKAVTDQPVAPLSKSPSQTVTHEKQPAAITINADILVSLLLIVVIRSQTRHLQARLSYMQRFIFIDDVESGEMGYALSTFEAVLTYLTRDAGGLRKASQRNRRLWDAVKSGNISGLKEVLEELDEAPTIDIVDEPESIDMPFLDATTAETSEPSMNGSLYPVSSRSSHTTLPKEPNLSHVFPFQAAESSASVPAPRKTGKKVTMDVRSMSISSAVSFRSRATTLDSTISGIEGDTSVESLAQTQDPAGNSALMMGVENRQTESLKYLLDLSEHYTPETVLADVTSEGTSLLSAAIQLAHTELIDIILDYAYQNTEPKALVAYLAKADTRGRTAAHYLFNAPQLMSKLTEKLPWRQKDKIGQTPLYALCRSYDHSEYSSMVSEALSIARDAQGDGLPLRLEEHTDNKGNTLLHIVNDPVITHRILVHCDVDPNAVNDKKFTPLMLASKYGRLDMVRVFFGDPRVDLNLTEARGLTAVELAKDDEVRNRIDDLTLFSSNPSTTAIPADSSSAYAKPHESTGRITTIVRSFFVEDGSVRFILKSGALSNASDATSTTYTITTSRRTLSDFENLAKWLALDHPASYLPSLALINFRPAFQIHSRPSRAVLHDTQALLDRFLKILLSHPTFSTHEMLWEFFLVPDMQSDQMAERAKLKAQLLSDTINDEYEPVSDVTETDQLTKHSRDMVRSINTTTRTLIRRGHNLQHAHADLSEALSIDMSALSTLGPPGESPPKPRSSDVPIIDCSAISQAHVTALLRYAGLMATSESSPLDSFIHTLTSFHSTNVAIQAALLRLTTFISRISSAQTELKRNRQNLNSQSLPRKFNFPGLEENRVRSMRDYERKIADNDRDIEKLGKELRYHSEVVVGELAGWTEWREHVGREAVRGFVRATVIKERERYKSMVRCLRALRESGGIVRVPRSLE